MQITLTKEQVKEAFGELRFMGADNMEDKTDGTTVMRHLP